MAGAEVHSLAFAARRADCAAASSGQAHRRAAVSRRRRLDGEGARRATINWMGHAVRFNLSDLWLEHALRAIMEIRAQLSSLDPRPRGPCAGPDFSCAGETVVPSFSLSLANLGREAPDLLLARSHSHHAAFGVGAASYPRA